MYGGHDEWLWTWKFFSLDLPPHTSLIWPPFQITPSMLKTVIECTSKVQGSKLSFFWSAFPRGLFFPRYFLPCSTATGQHRTIKYVENCTYKYFSHLMQYVRLSQNYLLIYLLHCSRTSIVTILDMDRAGWWQSAATPIGACSARSHTVYDDLTAMSVIGQSIAYHNWIACRLYMRRQSDTFAAFAWMTNKHAMWTNRQTATFLLQTVTICSHWPGQRNNYKQVY